MSRYRPECVHTRKGMLVIASLAFVNGILVTVATIGIYAIFGGV